MWFLRSGTQGGPAEVRQRSGRGRASGFIKSWLIAHSSGKYFSHDEPKTQNEFEWRKVAEEKIKTEETVGDSVLEILLVMNTRTDTTYFFLLSYRPVGPRL